MGWTDGGMDGVDEVDSGWIAIQGKPTVLRVTVTLRLKAGSKIMGLSPGHVTHEPKDWRDSAIQRINAWPAQTTPLGNRGADIEQTTMPTS